ncbi:MAG: hypothetical protein H7061_04280 [Bdellovibrionaceae bacterium]|nr:hypothetical protein [Bdellovibrio sp.]
MKNSTNYSSDQAFILIDENEVFEILAEEVRSNHSQKNVTYQPPASPPLTLKKIFKPTSNLPEFTVDKNTLADQQQLMQSLVFLEEENKFLKMNSTQLHESMTKIRGEGKSKTNEYKELLVKAESEIAKRQNQIECLAIEAKKNESVLELQLKEITLNHATALEENRKFKFAITDVNSKLVRAEEKEKTWSEKLEILNKDQRAQDNERNDQLIAQEKQTTALKYELFEKNRTTSELNSQVDELQTANQKYEQRLTMLTTDLDTAQLKAFEYNEKETLIDHLNTQVAEYASSMTHMNVQANQSQQQISELQLQLESAAKLNETASSLQSALLAHNNRLQIEISNLQSEAFKLASVNEVNNATIASHNESVNNLQIQIANEQAAVARLSQDLALATKEHQNASDTYQSRMRKLNSYFVEVEQTKTKFQSNLAKLTAEIQEAVRLHPLKDYLNLTSKEVIRVEIELKKTPTSSPNRKLLEKAIEQLINQREYLKGVIAQYEVSLSHKQASLDGMWNSVSALYTTKMLD